MAANRTAVQMVGAATSTPVPLASIRTYLLGYWRSMTAPSCGPE
ncbi:hypothetical protein [Granulicella sp. dw_53]|nr:hypothetical protein [Granulicella sp. dw_53]